MNTKENAVPLRRRISDAHNKKGSDLSGQNPFCCTFRCNSNAKQLSFFCRELFLCQNTRIKQRFIALELLYGIAACRRGAASAAAPRPVSGAFGAMSCISLCESSYIVSAFS